MDLEDVARKLMDMGLPAGGGVVVGVAPVVVTAGTVVAGAVAVVAGVEETCIPSIVTPGTWMPRTSARIFAILRAVVVSVWTMGARNAMSCCIIVP
jgi:hypothetical protein